MKSFVSNTTRDTAVFINDFDQEFADALQKLSRRLKRPLKGIILVDSAVKQAGANTPDKAKVFKQIVCDFSDTADIRRVTKSLEDKLLLVTCSSERNQPYLSRLLPFVPYIYGPTESSLDWSTHKAKMRELLTSYDKTFAPKVQVVDSAHDREIQKVIEALKFPVIVKPTGLAASILVSKAETPSDLKPILRRSFSVIKDVYKRDKGRGKPEMIVEEFIDGDRYSVDAYVDGEGKVWQLPLVRSKTAYEIGREGFHTYQNETMLDISAKEVATSRSITEGAIHALGLRSCVAHVELFRTKDGWRIIELGPRAGGQRQDIYSIAYGVDHAYNELLMKIGLEPEIKNKPIAYAMTVNIWIEPEDEGVILAIDGIDEVKENASYYSLSVRSQVGEEALTSTDGGKMIAVVVLHNKDIKQLRRDADLVRSTIKITTEKK